ncbi:MAG: hypothetical protein P1V97_24735 [Planctomycetota bacterium]|nr:hypothetical protein [Planctomycetota bacterium]
MNPNNSGEKLSLPNFVGVRIDRVCDHMKALGQPPSFQIRYEDSDAPRGTVLAQTILNSTDNSQGDPLLQLTVAAESWLRFLPAQYRRQDSAQSGEHLLFLLQERYEQTQKQLEELSNALNPIHCSLENLYRMADLSGRDYLRSWPELRARRVMSLRHELDRWRHTKKGLSLLLSQILPGWNWSIEETRSQGPLRVGQSRLGQDRLEPLPKPTVIVWLEDSLEKFGAERASALRQTLERERVAGSTFLLRFRPPSGEVVNRKDA